MNNLSKMILLLVIIIVGSGFLQSAIVNEDKPAKGEWNFECKQLWTVDKAGDQFFAYIGSLDVDEAGNCYVLDMKLQKLFAFSPEGKFLFAVGRQGEGPGEWRSPFRAFTKGKYIMVTEMSETLLHYFNKNGTFYKTFNLGGGVDPKLFFDEFKYLLYYSDPQRPNSKEKLALFDVTTKKPKLITETTAEKPLGSIPSSDGPGQILFEMTVAEVTPTILSFYSNNSLYFGNNSTAYSIQKVDLSGKELLSFSIKGRKLKSISSNAKKGIEEKIPRQLPAEQRSKVAKTIPDISTYFEQIVVDEKGFIYVYVSDYAEKTIQDIDIFSPDGKYLYRSKINYPKGYFVANSFLRKQQNGFLYVVLCNEDEDQKIFKFSIKQPVR